jgi:hypothetical protein
VLSRPSLQKYEHAKTATSDSAYLRECKDNNTGIRLRGHGFAQFMSGVVLCNSARARNDSQFAFTDILNGYIQHDSS